MYLNLGNIAESKRYAGEALATCKQLNLKSSMAVALIALGDTAFAEDDLAAAEQDYQKALSIRTEIGEKGGAANSWLSLAELDLEKKNLESAAKMAEGAAEEFHNEHNDDEEAMAHDILARVKREGGDGKGAREEADKSRQLNLQDKTVRFSLEITDALLQADAGKVDAAIRQLDATIERSRQMKLLQYEFKARLARSEISRKSNAPAAANLDLQRLQKEASEKGFALVARKAGRLLHPTPG
jgi:tetratricopeptide (TPR) repeat protein